MTLMNDSVETIKAFLGKTLQEQLPTTQPLARKTSELMQAAINDSVGDWLQEHPLVLQLVQLLLWATNHPIISIIVLIFSIAIAWILIKAVSRLIETAGLSLLQLPLTLGKFLLIVSAKFVGKFGRLAVKQVVGNQTDEAVILHKSTLQLVNSESEQINKQQRLTEIFTRLEAIQQEQNQLIQELSAILQLEKHQ